MSPIMWFFIIVLVLFLALAFKAKEVRHKIGLVVILTIVLFLIFSALQVYKSKQVDLTTFDGMSTAGKVYVAWLSEIYLNVKGAVGYVGKQDWNIKNVSDYRNKTIFDLNNKSSVQSSKNTSKTSKKPDYVIIEE